MTSENQGNSSAFAIGLHSDGNNANNAKYTYIPSKSQQILSCIHHFPWRRKLGEPTLAFLPGKSHGQMILAGYSPWDRKRVRHDLGTEHIVVVVQSLSRV